MIIKLHRCPVLFAKTSGHPCWKVQTALDKAGIDYEVVKQPIRKSKRTDFAARSGQRLLPAIELEDGSILREESTDLATRIRDGRLPRTRDRTSAAGTDVR
jgi:Glutathione S-transferase, N-terminal domain